jgi:hypothetical protein
VLLIEVCVPHMGCFSVMILACVVNHFHHCCDSLNASSSFSFFLLNLSLDSYFDAILNPARVSSFLLERKGNIVFHAF